MIDHFMIHSMRVQRHQLNEHLKLRVVICRYSKVISQIKGDIDQGVGTAKDAITSEDTCQKRY